REVTFELRPIKAFDAPPLIGVNKEMLFGARDVIQNKHLTARILEILIEFEMRRGHFSRSQDLSFYGSRWLLCGIRLFARRHVRADSQRQCENGDQRVAWFLQQCSRSIAQVLPNVFHRPSIACKVRNGVGLRSLWMNPHYCTILVSQIVCQAPGAVKCM